jgi:hypothetical protein
MMLETVWFSDVNGSPMLNFRVVGTTPAASERVCRMPSRSTRPLSNQ